MPQPLTSLECPSAEDLAAFNQGFLAEAALDTIAEHVSHCTRCEETLLLLAATPQGLLADLQALRGQAETPDDEPFIQDVLRAEAMATSVASGPALPPGEPPPQLRDYRLVAKLGQGGMGTVYRAIHTRLDRTVAVKVLTANRLPQADAVARFEREMKAVGKLNHPNIIRATDAGEAAGTSFLVMEFVEGLDLGRLLTSQGPPSVADACELARQAALGLHHAHEHGLIHRDVKPSNLLLTTEGEVKLLDLGLALLRGPHAGGADSTDTTASGYIMGSFDYMAPEQADDPHAVDARADLYSLGCTLYHLLAGKPPFAARGQSPIQALKAHAQQAPPPLADGRPDVPPRLARLVGRLLAKRADDRPVSAAAVADELAAFTAGSNLPMLIRCARPAGTGSDAQIAAQRRPQPPRRRPTRRRLIAALAGAALLLAASIILVQTNQGVLEIVTADDDVKVSVEAGGKEIVVIDLKEKREVRLRPGDYRLKLVEGGKEKELDRDEFTMTRGGKAVVTVRRVRQPITVVPPAGKHPALDDAWVKGLRELPPAEQVKAVVRELQRRNPAYDGWEHHATNGHYVTELALPANQITDITPVRALPRLKRFACNGQQNTRGKLTDLSPLKGMQLEILHLVCSSVSDLTPVAGMPLEELLISWSDVVSLEPLNGAKLKRLECAFGGVRDLTPLKGMPLRDLNVFETKVESLAPLAECKELRVLICGVCGVDDLSPIQKLPLTTLVCSGTRVTSLAPLKDMKTLRKLHCNSLRLDDLASLQGLTLHELAVDFDRERDTKLLRSMRSLETINHRPAAQFWRELEKADNP
jgi:hypothetical protein